MRGRNYVPLTPLSLWRLRRMSFCRCGTAVIYGAPVWTYAQYPARACSKLDCAYRGRGSRARPGGCTCSPKFRAAEAHFRRARLRAGSTPLTRGGCGRRALIRHAKAAGVLADTQFIDFWPGSRLCRMDGPAPLAHRSARCRFCATGRSFRPMKISSRRGPAFVCICQA